MAAYPRVRTRQHEWTSDRERGAVTRVLDLPVIRGVDHRVAPRRVVVSVDEILHPGHHGRFAQPVAGVAIGVGVVLDVERAGEDSPIPGPSAAAVREEVCRLGAAGT
jgi:hypothetical protein